MLSQPDFDCQEIHDLCPGEVVQVSCTLNVDQQIFVQRWEVHECKNKLKIDFNHENNHGDVNVGSVSVKCVQITVFVVNFKVRIHKLSA